MMSCTASHTDPQIRLAVEFSLDRRAWEPIPQGICVTGSRYAITLDALSPVQVELGLGQYEV